MRLLRNSVEHLADSKGTPGGYDSSEVAGLIHEPKIRRRAESPVRTVLTTFSRLF
ncbi:hypothetical protein N9B24_02295 [bacterium]|nr:hypothetical protein [bacterium]